MLFPLFIGLEAVYASHISFASPIANQVTCSPCMGMRVCESLANAPLINLMATSDCNGNCDDWSLVVPQLVEPLDSASAWEVATPVISLFYFCFLVFLFFFFFLNSDSPVLIHFFDQLGYRWAPSTTVTCGDGYYLFGFRVKCKDRTINQLICKNATNLYGWSKTNPVVSVAASQLNTTVNWGCLFYF